MSLVLVLSLIVVPLLALFIGLVMVTALYRQGIRTDQVETVVLWHPESPGQKVRVYPNGFRYVHLYRSKFATLSEVLRSVHFHNHNVYLAAYNWTRPGESYVKRHHACSLPGNHGPHVIGWPTTEDDGAYRCPGLNR